MESIDCPIDKKWDAINENFLDNKEITEQFFSSPESDKYVSEIQLQVFNLDQDTYVALALGLERYHRLCDQEISRFETNTFDDHDGALDRKFYGREYLPEDWIKNLRCERNLAVAFMINVCGLPAEQVESYLCLWEVRTSQSIFL